MQNLYGEQVTTVNVRTPLTVTERPLDPDEIRVNIICTSITGIIRAFGSALQYDPVPDRSSEVVNFVML